MDQQNEHQNLQTVDKFNKYQFLKKTLQFLFSVSLFSFLISYSSVFSLFLHTSNLYFSTFQFERKYVFLISNGILAFLFTSFGFSGSSQLESDPNSEFLKRNENGVSSVSESSLMKATVVDKDVAEGSSIGSLDTAALVVEELEQEEEAKEKQNGTSNTEEHEREGGALIIEEEEEEYGTLFTAADEVNEGLPSIEELKKRCDDFIRRMKEEIRIGAQRQLIAV